jgi:parallel beta-helix repeat protein
VWLKEIYKIMRYKWMIVIIIFFFTPSPVRAEATHFVDSVLATSTLWTADKSPYIIDRDIEVPLYGVLTIEQGVVVKFAENGRLIISGSLKVNGSPENRVYFTSLKDNSISGDSNADGASTTPSSSDNWSVYFRGSGTLVSEIKDASFSFSSRPISLELAQVNLQDVDISNCKNGINVKDSLLTLKGGNLRSIDQDGIDGQGAVLFISSTVINGVQHGDGIGIYGNSSLHLLQGDFSSFNQGNALGVYSSSAYISNSVFSQGYSDGIGVYKENGIDADKNPWPDSHLEIGSSTISDFSNNGIYLDSGDNIVEDSKITHNDTGIFVAKGNNQIIGNNISGNVSDGVFYGIRNSLIPLDLRANWWGYISGPATSTNYLGIGDAIDSVQGANILYRPWLMSDPHNQPHIPLKKGFSNVVFIPGVEASRLYINDGKERQLWEPSTNSDVEKLFLDQNGKSQNPEVYTRDILDQVNLLPFGLGKNIYKGFIDYMNNLVTQKVIHEWRPFPYDWRLDPQDIISDDNFINQIRQLVSSSDSGFVTIVTHSNGAFIAKRLIQKLEAMKQDGGDTLIDSIDKLILIAAPELGSPKALGALLHGDGQELLGGFILTKENARKFTSNMSSAYNFIPSKDYFLEVSNPVISFDTSVSKVLHNSDFDSYGSTISSYADLSDFLLGIKDARVQATSSDTNSPLVLNSILQTQAENTHQELDDMTWPSALRIVQIAGWNLDTVSGLSYFGKDQCYSQMFVEIYTPCTHIFSLEHKPIFTKQGDEDVIGQSATALPVTSYYLDFYAYNKDQSIFSANKNHEDITEVSSVQSLVRDLITDKVNQNNYVLPSYISPSPPDGTSNKRLKIEVDSSVFLDVFDKEGNHTGILDTSDPADGFLPDTPLDPNATKNALRLVEKKIPNSVYQEIGGERIITLDQSAGPYTIKLQGRILGSVTLNFEEDSPDGSKIVTFADIPVSPLFKAEIVVDQIDNTMELSVDADGDGNVDFTIDPSFSFDPVLYLESLRVIMNTFCVSSSVRDDLIGSIDDIETAIDDGDISDTDFSSIRNYVLDFEHNINDPYLNDDEKQSLVISFGALLDQLLPD